MYFSQLKKEFEDQTQVNVSDSFQGFKQTRI